MTFQDDGFYFIDFVKKYTASDVKFKSLKDLKKKLFVDIPRVIAKIEVGKGIIIKKDSSTDFFNMVKYSDKWTDLKIIYTEVTKSNDDSDDDGDKKETVTTKTLKLAQFINKYAVDMKILYNKIVCKPITKFNENELKLEVGEFNVWSGFLAKEVNSVDMKLIDPIINHIEKIWCSGNKEYARYIISWFSHALKFPDKKTRTALCLFSLKEQVAGKSLINGFICKNIYGPKLALMMRGPEDLTKNFNNLLLGKILVVCDEIGTKKRGNFHSVPEVLKNMITETSLTIEPKGKNSFSVDQGTNIIMNGNGDCNSLKLGSEAPRYATFDCSNELQNDQTNYYENLTSHLNNQNKSEIANHLYTYFIRYNGIRNLQKEAPKTELKDNMILMSRSTLDKFLLDVKENKLFELDDHGKETEVEIKSMTAHEIKDRAIMWCHKNNFKTDAIPNVISLGIKLSKVMKSKTGAKNVKYYDMTSISL